jgi:hypothetical protein
LGDEAVKKIEFWQRQINRYLASPTDNSDRTWTFIKSHAHLVKEKRSLDSPVDQEVQSKSSVSYTSVE